VEILPGPQGTLYGRNSTGGVVNITSRTPGDKLGVDGFLEVGNYNHIQAMVGVDLPLSDTLSSRTAVTHNRHDGYINNGEDDQKTTAVRETLLFRPSDATKVTLVGTYTHEGGIGNLVVNVPTLGCGFRCATFDPKALGFYNNINIYETSLTLEQKLGDHATLTYIGGYSDLNQDFYGGLAYGPPLFPANIPETSKVLSQEARINATLGKLQGLVGAYYFHDRSDVGGRVTVGPSVVTNPFETVSHGAAVYGQGTFSVTNALRLTGGLRYSNTIKSIDGVSANYSAATGAARLRGARRLEGQIRVRSPAVVHALRQRSIWFHAGRLQFGAASDRATPRQAVRAGHPRILFRRHQEQVPRWNSDVKPRRILLRL
jgi:iron complex outermembrane receptor protein